jgi:hypothetical protein
MGLCVSQVCGVLKHEKASVVHGSVRNCQHGREDKAIMTFERSVRLLIT